MTEKIKFLCGNFENVNFVYGITFGEYDWHYFQMKDTLASEHSLLPDRLHLLIGALDVVKSIEVPLSADQLKHYFSDGKFIFKSKELKTRLALIDEQFGETLDGNKTKTTSKSTDKLSFIPGKSNPLLFINEFVKCSDVPTDNDKMFKLRKFVNDSHRVEFSELCFTSDWASVKETFLKKYSLSFTLNKKLALNIDFGEEDSLQLFVKRKLKALSSYTTLPFINQMEITLNDLPSEVSNLFIINEMMNKDETTILEYCDSIQDLVTAIRQKSNELERMPKIQELNDKNSINEMEEYDFETEESSDQQSVASVQAIGRRRGRERPPKNLSESDESTNSTWSGQSELSNADTSTQYLSKTKGNIGGRGKVAGRGRIVKKSRPSKVLKSIAEHIGSKTQSDQSMDNE